MGMMFCRGCGKQIHDSALSCPHCGALAQGQTVAQVASQPSPPPPPLPEGVAGWSWGALFLNLIWAIGNKTWVGLLSLVPVLGLVMPFVLAVKGREWAWRNGTWRDVDHFRAVQRKWDIAAFSMLASAAALFVILAVIGAIQEHNSKTLAQYEAEYTTSSETTLANNTPTPAPAPAPLGSAPAEQAATTPTTAILLEAYNQADLQLNQSYKTTMARLGPALRQGVRDQQRAWIKQRDASCGSMNASEADAQRAALQCLLSMTQKRTQEIQAM